MGRDNRRARTDGPVHENRIGGVSRTVNGFPAYAADSAWYYRRRTFDGRVYTGPASRLYAAYPPGTRPIPARPL